MWFIVDLTATKQRAQSIACMFNITDCFVCSPGCIGYCVMVIHSNFAKWKIWKPGPSSRLCVEKHFGRPCLMWPEFDARRLW